MRVYEFQGKDGYEWVTPEAEGDYSVFEDFDGTSTQFGRPPYRRGGRSRREGRS